MRACVPASVGARMQVVGRAAAHLAQRRPSLRKRQQGRGDQAMSGADVRREQRPSRRLAAVKRQRNGRRLREARRLCTAGAQAAVVRLRIPEGKAAVCAREGDSSREAASCRCRGAECGHAAVRATWGLQAAVHRGAALNTPRGEQCARRTHESLPLGVRPRHTEAGAQHAWR